MIISAFGGAFGAQGSADSEPGTALNQLLLWDGSKWIHTTSTLTNAEVGYLTGITSGVQSQINSKQATLVSGTNIKTINGNSILGSGDMLIYSCVSISAALTLNSTHELVECTANTFNITLPTAVGNSNKQYIIKNTGTGIITIDTTLTQTIDGELTQTLNQWDSITLRSNNSNWIII